MRVFARVLILGGLLSALAPAPANAAPILLPSGDSGGSCLNVLGVANSNCGLFSLGTLTGGTTFDFDLVFASYLDVALFEFSIDADATFAAESSTELSLGLFSEMKTAYEDPVTGEQALANKVLEGFLLNGAVGGTTYYLGVVRSGNDFTGIPTSLVEPLACYGENGDGLDPNGQPLCPGEGGTFRLQFSATQDGGPQPVPEPATFTLVVSGALAAIVRRRSIKRNQRRNVSRT
jgi:hypothetical protein